jgi:phosphoribosylanthranilate isomerase
MGYHLRIKICGVTNADDAVHAALAGADALGLNFYPHSPRCLTPERAAGILDALPPFVEPVGLFVREPFAALAGTLAALPRLRAVQWHGEACEPAAACPLPLIAAFPVRDAASLAAITGYLERCQEAGRLPAAVLVDAHVPGLHGGTGQTAPWELLERFRPGVPLILAGGLTPDNVAEAVVRVRPFAVDVASGVESSPGRKDPGKVRDFLQAAREAAWRLA